MSALSESILETIKSNGGTITIKEAEEKNISPKKLQRMVKQGSLERVTRGLYLHPEFLEDSYYIFQHRAPKAIFSHETALYLHKLSDENPHKIIATIPSGYNTSMIKERDKYLFYYLKKDLWEKGQEKIKSPFGNLVYVYTKEITLVQMISKLNGLDKDLVLTALKRGLKNAELDKLELLRYSKYFKCEEQMRNYLEVLI